MQYKLSVPEEFALLAFEGKIFMAEKFYTVNACMMELFYRGRLGERDSKVEIFDATTTGLEFLDIVLDKIAKANKAKSLRKWMVSIFTVSRRAKKLISDQLIKKGILKRETARFLFLIPFTHLIENDTGAREKVVEKIRAQVLEEGPMDLETLGLSLLLQQAGLLKRFFSTYEHEKMELKLIQLQHSEPNNLSIHLIKTVKEAYVALASSSNVVVGG